MFEEIGQAVDHFRERVGAQSCTLYVRDPIWPDQYYLVSLPGVKYPEPMFGFNARKSATIIAGTAASGVATHAADARYHNPPAVAATNPGIFLADFASREGVRSCARAVVNAGTDGEAVLFVNFSEDYRATPGVEGEAEKFLRDHVPAEKVRAELLSLEAQHCFPRIVRILAPSHSPVVHDLQAKESRRTYFARIASLILSTLGLDESTSVVSIHLLERTAQELRLEGHAGALDNPTEADHIALDKDRGLTSWVAMMQDRAILISNLNVSPFGRLHIPFMNGALSEVAVPILLGDDFIGVLNVESKSENAFDRQTVRTLWYAAAKLALAYRLHAVAFLNDSLLRLCSEATVRKGDLTGFLDPLAALTADQMCANQCEVWLWDHVEHQFVICGSTGQMIEQPRETGWTRYVMQQGEWPVWLATASEPMPFYWRRDKWTTESPAETTGLCPPTSLHKVVVEQGIRGHLAVPIKLTDRVCGVAWFRYRDREQPLGRAEMAGLRLFMPQLAFVAEVAMARRYSVEKAQVKDISSRIADAFLNEGACIEYSGRPEAFLEIAAHCASVDPGFGGDFFSLVSHQPDTVALLVGDGKGHGIQGTLNMLPLVGVVRKIQGEARSSSHVIQHLRETADFTGVSATAISVFFRRTAGLGSSTGTTITAYVTSAGHPGALVVDPAGTVSVLPSMEEQGTLLGLSFPTAPPAESRFRIAPGSTVVVCTDGLLSAMSHAEIVEIVRRTPALTVGELARKLVGEAEARNSRQGLSDDVTAIVIREKA